MPRTDPPRGFDRELGPGGLETRTLDVALAQVRAADSDDGRLLVGYGSVFDTPYRVQGFFSVWDEEVAAGAFTDAIGGGADVRSMRNHDTNYLLGRTTTGTLRLEEDDTGLRYEVDINPDDPTALSTLAQVDRGDIDGSSIWFRIEKQEWTYPNDDNGLEVPRRRLLQIRPLFEVGPVVFPASPTTSVGARTGEIVDAVLRSAGVDQPGERARLAAELLADPSAAVELLNAIDGARRRVPDDADEPAGRPGTTARELEMRRRRGRGLAAMHGLD